MENYIGKDPDDGKDWKQGEKGMTEDEIVGWHHRTDGHEFEQALGAGDGQRSLACCSPWSHKELDTTEQLNWWLINFISQLPTIVCVFPGGPEVKSIPADAGDAGSIPGSEGTPGEGMAINSSILAWEIHG